MKFFYLIGFFLFTTVIGCQEEKETSRPNILLIVSEDNSEDLGCYGNNIVHTPHLDNLAKNGMRFTKAYTTYSVCSPSRSSIFTGLYPHQNGQLGWATHGYSLYEGIKVLPNYLNEAGYRSACLGKIHVNPESIFNFDYKELNHSNFSKEKLTDYAHHAKTFVDDKNDKPYFLMVNFPDAHLPFQNEVEGLPTVRVDTQDIKTTLPFVGVNTARLRSVTEEYYNCMNRLDESVGMLLDSIGDLSNTLIIYISDHGAQFSRGKLTNYEGGLKIPFIIQWQDKYKMKELVNDQLVSVVDLLPTILDVAGAEIPATLPGRSLIQLLDPAQKDEEWRTYLGADGEGASPVMYYPRRSIRNERYKLIENIDIGRVDFPAFHSYANPAFASGASIEEIGQATEKIRAAYAVWKNPPKYELYDLQKDPWEWNNLSANSEHGVVLEELKAAMLDWRVKSNDPLLDQGKLDAFTHEMDSINQLYPNHTYRKHGLPQWKYLDYLKPSTHGK